MDKDCWGDLDFGWPWVELYPQKDVLKSSCLVPVHVTIFGNRVSSNAIRLKGGHVEFGCLVFYKSCLLYTSDAADDYLTV